MVSIKTADFAVAIIDGGVVAPREPGLGVTPDMSILGEPIAHYS
jgi:hypothetical protein